MGDEEKFTRKREGKKKKKKDTPPRPGHSFGYWMTVTGMQKTPLSANPFRRLNWKMDIYSMSQPLLDCNGSVRSYDKNEAIPICKYNGWIYQLIDFYGEDDGMKGWTIWTDWAGSDVLSSVPRAIIAYNRNENARDKFPTEVASQQQLWDKNRNDPVWARTQRELELRDKRHALPEELTTGLCLRLHTSVEGTSGISISSHKMCDLKLQRIVSRTDDKGPTIETIIRP